jgi:hypothetical protein
MLPIWAYDRKLKKWAVLPYIPFTEVDGKRVVSARDVLEHDLYWVICQYPECFRYHGERGDWFEWVPREERRDHDPKYYQPKVLL